jgi:hypothetical protein
LAQKKRARLGGLSLKITNFGLDITDLLMEVRRFDLLLTRIFGRVSEALKAPLEQ